jgi:hypothetical protein
LATSKTFLRKSDFARAQICVEAQSGIAYIFYSTSRGSRTCAQRGLENSKLSLRKFDFALLKESAMNQFVAETRIAGGRLELLNLPFSDTTEVKVVVIPKADLSKMSFLKARELTSSIKGKLSDSVSRDRSER